MDVQVFTILPPEGGGDVKKQVEIFSLDRDGSSLADISPNFSAGPSNVPLYDDKADFEESDGSGIYILHVFM